MFQFDKSSERNTNVFFSTLYEKCLHCHYFCHAKLFEVCVTIQIIWRLREILFKIALALYERRSIVYLHYTLHYRSRKSNLNVITII